ncbi:hypothetical protein LTR37_002742 [Vermiconidia calcicola]|uniref:Uncharacterized protein n=1 Tax=Vermiconidia calcicola TaxID=1690605 RepID=A0ACC3NS32_9PEZI|nr:hypothetical protein LTR37_002742 [Vermiconidia calcicola]
MSLPQGTVHSATNFSADESHTDNDAQQRVVATSAEAIPPQPQPGPETEGVEATEDIVQASGIHPAQDSSAGPSNTTQGVPAPPLVPQMNPRSRRTRRGRRSGARASSPPGYTPAAAQGPQAPPVPYYPPEASTSLTPSPESSPEPEVDRSLKIFIAMLNYCTDGLQGYQLQAVGAFFSFAEAELMVTRLIRSPDFHRRATILKWRLGSRRDSLDGGHKVLIQGDLADQERVIIAYILETRLCDVQG